MARPAAAASRATSRWCKMTQSVILLMFASCLQAQPNPPSQARDLLSLTPSVDLPTGALTPDSSSSRMQRFPNRSATPVPSVQIVDKPSAGPTPALRLSTTVETRLDNRTASEKIATVGGEPDVAPAKEAPRPAVRFSFEDFVQQSMGAALPLFGESVFSSPSPSYVAPDQLPLPPDYLLRAGDEISTRAWGQIEIDHVGVVDRLGQLYIPRVGVIRVAGIRRDQLDAVIRTALEKQFRNFELSTMVGTAQPILVHITGAAKKPGSVSLPAYSTLLTAAFQSGGALPKANFRRVQLRRGGVTVAELDLYDFLASGNNKNDVPVRSGDVIHFGIVEGLVAIGGSVNVPGIFQLKANMTLGELLELSGGITTTGATRQAVVERIVEHRERTTEVIALDAAALARPLRDGEFYTITPISPRIENAVTLSGNVALPLRVAFRPGMRISDLIPSADALMLPSYWEARNQQHPFSGLSAQRSPEIKKELPEINWEYAVVERLDKRTIAPRLIPFNLGLAITVKDGADNLLLEAGDTVTVFSKSDFRIRSNQKTRYVKVEGEIKNAGMYSVDHGTSLRQILATSGGLTSEAYVYGLELTRESTRKFQQARMNESIDKLEQEFQRYFATRARNITSQEEALAAPAESESLKTLIARLRAMKATGRIVLELTPDADSINRLPDVALEDGDTVFVPTIPATIGVVGAVVQEGTFLFGFNKRLADYLRQAGGRTRHGDEGRLYILRADGSVLSGEQGFLGKAIDSSMVLAPGDTIVIPENPERVSWVRALKDWTQVFYQFGLGAAGIRILRGF